MTKTLRFQLATEQRPDIPRSSMFQKALEASSEPAHVVGKWGARSDYRKKQKQRRRTCRFRRAVAYAYATDLPLTVGITISWDALIQAGEKNEGHCLGRKVWEREAYLRRELARLCRSLGLLFAALWGRDVGRVMGSHVHLAMFLPMWRSDELGKLVRLLERVTGSPAAFIVRPYSQDIVARSVCGGWQVEVNNSRDAQASALRWADYIAEQEAKHPDAPDLEGKAFGISEALSKAAQRRAAPLLAAREAENGWMRKGPTDAR